MIPIEKNIVVIDDNNNKYNPTYLRRAKGLVKNGRARWINNNTISLACPLYIETEDQLMQNKTKMLENVMPTSEWMAFSFVDCYASLLMSKNKRINPNSSVSLKKRSKLYESALVASGLAFSCLHKINYQESQNINFHQAVPNDNYIPYTMNFGNCNYHSLEKNSHNKDELKRQIIKTIDHDIPALLEFEDSTWSIITGYENDGEKLYGYIGYSYSPNVQLDGFLENKMFYTNNWFEQLNQILIIDDFEAKNFDTEKYLNYWIEVMEYNKDEAYIYGLQAIDSYIDLLSDDTFYLHVSEDSFHKAFRYIFTLSNICESRCFIWTALCNTNEEYIRSHIGLSKDVSENVQLQMDKIIKNGMKMHKLCWQFWEALSEKGIWIPDSVKYGDKLKNPKNRKNAANVLKKLKACDMNILDGLHNLVLLN